MRAINGLRKAILAAFALTLVGAPAAMADESVTTARPDLRSVTATGPTQVRVCFDGPIASTFNFTDGNFFLLGYDVYRRTGPSSGLSISGAPQVDSTNPQCALVNFYGDGDVRTFSLAVIGDSVVSDTTGHTNRRSSVKVDGSFIPPESGRTPAPDLLSYTVTLGQDFLDRTITYKFDEPLVNIADLRKFGFYSDDPSDAGGVFHPANRIVNFQKNTDTVTVGFDATASQFVPRVARAVVLNGAVTGQQIEDNSAGTIDDNSGRTSTRPAVGKIGLYSQSPLAYAFDFTQNVTTITDPAKLFLYDSNGAMWRGRTNGTARIDPNNPRRVIVEVEPFSRGADRGQIVIGGAFDDAVRTVQINANNTQTTAPNIAGTLGMIPLADHPGFSTGPDLIYVDFDRSRSDVYFYFDEQIRDVRLLDDPNDVDNARYPDFGSIDAQGNYSRAQVQDPALLPIITARPDPAAPNDNSVARVRFSDTQLSSAVAVYVNEHAVADVDDGRIDTTNAGDFNPMSTTVPQSLRPNVPGQGTGQPPFPSGPSSSTGTTPGAGGSTTTTTRKQKTSNTGLKLRITRKRSARTKKVYQTRFTGSVRSGSKLCKPGRLILIRKVKVSKSGTRRFVTVARIYSKDNGTFKYTLRGSKADGIFELYAPATKVSNETRDVTCNAANK